MKYLRLISVALMLFCISMKADAGIEVREKGSHDGKFELIKEFKVTMPKYSHDKNADSARHGTDKKSGATFVEDPYMPMEFIYPSNMVVAGETLRVRLYRVTEKVDQEDFEEFLDYNNADFIALRPESTKFKKVSKQDMSNIPLWKNSKIDPGIPLYASYVDEHAWYLSGNFDQDLSRVREFLVFQRW